MNFYSSQLSECKHHELLSAKGAEERPRVTQSFATPPVILLFTAGFFPGFVTRALFTSGAVPGRAGPARLCRAAAMPPCPALRKLSRSPRRPLPFCIL